jgi:MarR family transcriptional regulator, organic hydroperoxide resistance regulator
MAARKSKPPLTVSSPALLVGDEDRVFRQFVHDTLAFAARIQAVRSGFAGVTGLSDAGYSILISIRHLEGGDEEVGINRLAEHLHLSGAFVTIEVGKLVKLGMVKKETHADDRRRVVLSVTDRGSQTLANLAPIQRPVNDALFSALTASDFRHLSSIMSKLTYCGDEALEMLAFMASRQARA